ncbi:hypothetical protein C8R43DRAFT_1120920 [Mycena crocata]|nr:hypothetical protein C8R43DRAFT_1120920 [Mycena crocata]
MKFVLTGATGFVGGEVLAQCRRNPAISSIVVLTRRPLPEPIAADNKVQAIIMDDFKTYSDQVAHQLADADACIWAIGARAAVPEVEIDYPLALARAIIRTRTPQQKPFRYIYCSGILAERDQSKALWVAQSSRRIKGAAENSIIAFAKEKQHKDHWETYIAKPGMVLRADGDVLKNIVTSFQGNVKVNVLAAALIDVVSQGSKEQTLQNAEIVSRGTTALLQDSTHSTAGQ